MNSVNWGRNSGVVWTEYRYNGNSNEETFLIGFTYVEVEESNINYRQGSRDNDDSDLYLDGCKGRGRRKCD